MPEIYNLHQIVDGMFPAEKVERETNRMIHRLASSIGIKSSDPFF
ncbi:MAG: hypothetical protein Q9M89_09270 [Persephonella sp.]|nr:hypothetical protein [Persephonella sp.]